MLRCFTEKAPWADQAVTPELFAMGSTAWWSHRGDQDLTSTTSRDAAHPPATRTSIVSLPSGCSLLFHTTDRRMRKHRETRSRGRNWSWPTHRRCRPPTPGVEQGFRGVSTGRSIHRTVLGHPSCLGVPSALARCAEGWTMALVSVPRSGWIHLRWNASFPLTSEATPSRRRWPVVVVGGFLGLLMVAGMILGGIAWGRPHLTWRFQVADNRLTLRLAPGGGPLAGWLLSHSSLAVEGHQGQKVMLSLHPGSRDRLAPVVRSIWATTMRITVRVPQAPALLSTSFSPHTVTLSFSMAVSPRNAPCGLPEQAPWVTTLVFPRGSSPCLGTLDVGARSGERARMVISIPALGPPPPPPRPLSSSAPAPVVSFGPPGGGAFYITIDDGVYPDPGVLTLTEDRHVPITAFLISNVAAEHLDYWRSFLAAGGDIEDHTVSHPNLTRLSEAAAETQWAGAGQAFKTWFGRAPSLGRPPYGVVNAGVQVAASQAGLRDVVLWSASMYNGQLSTYDHRPLRAGEIVILHWIPGLYQSLVQLLAIASAQGLHPAPLAASLAAL